jgi:hypothetical protein
MKQGGLQTKLFASSLVEKPKTLDLITWRKLHVCEVIYLSINEN